MKHKQCRAEQMAKSSINFKAVKTNSESHNNRVAELGYVHKELTENNEHWDEQSIASRLEMIEESCKNISGRKLQKNATPIREGVVNLQPHHTMKDLKNLAAALEKKHQIKCFQIHIHNDEGKSKDELNHHAHMVFDWQDKKKGSMLRLNKLAMSKIQDTISETLGMERGKVGSKSVRLEAQEFKQTKQIENNALTIDKQQQTIAVQSQEIETSKKKVTALNQLPKDLGLNQKEKDTLAEQKVNTQALNEQTKSTRRNTEILEIESSNNQEKLTNSSHSIMREDHINFNKEILKSEKKLEKLRHKLANYLLKGSKSLEYARKKHKGGHLKKIMMSLSR